jgi:hypothetical protein
MLDLGETAGDLDLREGKVASLGWHRTRSAEARHRCCAALTGLWGPDFHEFDIVCI